MQESKSRDRTRKAKTRQRLPRFKMVKQIQSQNFTRTSKNPVTENQQTVKEGIYTHVIDFAIVIVKMLTRKKAKNIEYHFLHVAI